MRRASSVTRCAAASSPCRPTRSTPTCWSFSTASRGCGWTSRPARSRTSSAAYASNSRRSGRRSRRSARTSPTPRSASRRASGRRDGSRSGSSGLQAWTMGRCRGNPDACATARPNPPRLVAWRPAHEQIVLQAGGVRGLVIRPGDVYGGPGGLTGQWFAGPSTGSPPLVVGDGRNRVPMVHVDDLADAYVRVATSGLAAEIFNVNDQSRFTVLEMATAAARAAGYQGEVRPTPLVEARKTLRDLADALALSQHIDARKVVRLLGWHPSHEGFLDEADVHYRAWKAYRD